jgi:hypothetical protein
MCRIKRLVIFPCFLLISFNVLSQKSTVDNLAEEFVQFQANALQEKLYVHTDKTFYLAGEIIRFKLYATDGTFHKPLSISSVAYVDVTDNNHKPLFQAKINMQEGTGNGSFAIPSGTGSGNYTLRAYTNWMKNFSPDYYFEETITIVNTLKKSSNKAPVPPDTFSVQFFPEGGNLVYGLPSKVAFKATNQFGNGIDCNGAIVNQKNDTVARFQTLKFGMGNFLWTPKSGDIYTALVFVNKVIVSRPPLPVIYNRGYVMDVKDIGDRKIKVSVQAAGDLPDNVAYLFVQTRHLIKNVQRGKISNDKIDFFLDKETMGEGISHLTIFDADKHPVCERLFFKKPLKRLLINAAADQKEYTTRSKITIDLNTTDQSGQVMKANMSASVFFIDSLQSFPGENILTYLLLSSDLKGKIENPEYYFSNDDAAAAEAMDNLMLTQGWRRFKWEDVLSNREPYFKFLPESEGHIITGRIFNKSTGMPAKNSTAYLSVPGKYFSLVPSAGNATGDVLFNTKSFFDKNELIIQTDSRADSNFRVETVSPFSDTFSVKPPAYFSLSDKVKNQLLNRSINMQADNIYGVEKKSRFSVPVMPDTTAFYGYPDKEYYLDDFRRFITMEEVLKEYIKEVRVRNQNNKFYFNIKNPAVKNFFENDPLILLDGVPVFDAGTIMAFDPLKIKKIEVVTERYYAGPIVCDGIITFKTYEGDLAGYELDPNAIVLEYEGLQRQREFYSPVYETAEQIESRIPDFRNLLFWSPEINTDASGKTKISFYSSELVGKFVVCVQGLTQSGLPGSAVLSFIVNKK